MLLNSVLTPLRTLDGVPGGSKKRLLEFFGKYISQQISTLDSIEVFDNLIARERLGSTGVGEGIAIPHCRVKNCTESIGTFIRLKDKIDFDAIDGKPVDLLFVLLVPEEANDQHLNLLSTLAEKFSNPEFCRLLREAPNAQELYQLWVTD
ncbi:PTS IIA-like nitrogen-regulatory protein PtsN [Oceanospirillum multiglobuliferum]|uniref:PTS IIA-like nitrogen-regulatory protein PtsN n=1 Tax=Oceanospirillum multiglobuliferum TaxID=64969 RepID=A0A1T4KUC2_9GAMM|nr:PTS IIA-like nitrogen regulatory protein PtsN [Oceanospirillum multiglobuliferum]OPX54948.1 PTS IIA-like nitrogen-regulatory protein PtsN [Oceanospirillum multiglobuliferum]SJZ45996.1 PTS IIA-like nitrogen-regulatory protein PtsN [Oceanospirillum multiglobuliferum]